jgi:hypothetical protein
MYKNPIIAAILSIIPGAGHIYAMGPQKGFKRALFFLGCISLSMWLCFLVVGFLTTPIFWLWCVVDAAGMAKLENNKGCVINDMGRNES